MDIYTLSQADILIMAEMLTRADLEGKEVRVSMQNGLMVKVGGGMWTHKMGTKE